MEQMPNYCSTSCGYFFDIKCYHSNTYLTLYHSLLETPIILALCACNSKAHSVTPVSYLSNCNQQITDLSFCKVLKKLYCRFRATLILRLFKVAQTYNTIFLETLRNDKYVYTDCNSIIKSGVTDLVLELQAHKAKIKGVS